MAEGKHDYGVFSVYPEGHPEYSQLVLARSGIQAINVSATYMGLQNSGASYSLQFHCVIERVSTEDSPRVLEAPEELWKLCKGVP